MAIWLLVAAVMFEPATTPIVLPSQPAPLHGTALLPDGAARAVAVILPGSGPTDRDGNIERLGVVAGTYRLLAEALARRGIATVRVDKRGIGESAAAASAEADLLFGQLAEDARAWAGEAARRAGQRCSWLVGHSEGALVALAAAQENAESICGLVLLAGPGRPLGELLREQLRAGLPPELNAEALRMLSELEAGRTVDEVPSALAAVFRPSVQPYLMSVLSLDPAALLAAYRGPVLAARGETDLQVAPADLAALEAARPDVRTRRWPGVNHILKLAPAERAANLATYQASGLPIAPVVAEDISQFILSASPEGRGR